MCHRVEKKVEVIPQTFHSSSVLCTAFACLELCPYREELALGISLSKHLAWTYTNLYTKVSAGRYLFTLFHINLRSPSTMEWESYGMMHAR